MDIDELRHLISKGESETLEFKKSTGLLKAIFQTLTAFLNHKGGTVLVGVLDNGKIIGQAVNESTRQKIAKALPRIEPTAQVEIQYIPIDTNRQAIALSVLPGKHVPYIYDGRAYQRDLDDTNRMPQNHYEQLLVERGHLNYSWEEATASEYRLSDLDHEEIYRTVMEGIAEKRIPALIAKEKPANILRQLNLTADGKLKRAAAVLFAKEIKSGYLQCWLKMARFRGGSKTNDFIDNQHIYCNVFRMLEEVDHFLSRHLPIASYFRPDEWKRIDKPALPVIAVREALVNAICHRSYEEQSGCISVAIFDDRLEIWSSGTLPKALTISDLKRSHDSVLRNELITRVFYLRGYIEAWGTGTITMNDLCKENGIPPVEFSERTGGLLVTFTFASPLGNYVPIESMELTDRQREILNLLKQSPLNGALIAESLEGAPSVRTVQKDLVRLEEAQLVERKGRARAVVWHIINE